MVKKTNTKDLIKAITNTEKQDSADVLLKIKEERVSSKTFVEGDKKLVFHKIMDESSIDESELSNETLNRSKKKPDTDPLSSQEDSLTNEQNKLWSEFNEILDAEFYRDKKETFLMSLSGECLSQYEKISNGIGYKLGKKASRNEIIRKVLEDYMHYKRDTLEIIINKL